MDFNPNQEEFNIFERQLPDKKKVYFKELSGCEYIELMKLSHDDAELLKKFIELSFCNSKGEVFADILSKLTGKTFNEIARLSGELLISQLPQKKS